MPIKTSQICFSHYIGKN